MVYIATFYLHLIIGHCMDQCIPDDRSLHAHYNDFDIRNGALFTLLAIYCFMLGVILSGTTEIITVFLARMSKSSVSRRRCVFIRATVVLLIIAVIGRITWYNPAPGEEADALNRYIGRVIIPCFLVNRRPDVALPQRLCFRSDLK